MTPAHDLALERDLRARQRSAPRVAVRPVLLVAETTDLERPHPRRVVVEGGVLGRGG
jgi:hypothetical protein